MDQNLFSQILDSIKMVIGILLLAVGFWYNQNQFLMILGGFLMFVSGIEINIGKVKIKSPSRKGKR